jgi:hypothetical protein
MARSSQSLWTMNIQRREALARRARVKALRQMAGLSLEPRAKNLR